MPEPLSARLRLETKQAHTRAERSGLMRDLLTGTLDPQRYVALLANLHAVYGTLEPALERHARDPLIAPIHDRALDRVGPLERDLLALAGPGWKEAFPPTAATAAYVARLQSADADPALLVAHSYTRYLGDLSGGQILKRIVLQLLGERGTGAVSFYEFPGIPDPDAFKQRYRAALDAMPLDGIATDRLVAEALEAFDLNARLFESLT
jgi:heme oxygenase